MVKSLLCNTFFYIIDDNYIEYLSQFDKHIAYNKNEKRLYIGIVIIVEKHYYFAPLFSTKQKHKRYKNNLTFFGITNLKAKIRVMDIKDYFQNSTLI